ncbi:hypothetical protein CRM22_004347 [Opisthorchis felineus]|uniref:Uncharacterized protein n=1 Tax=Opisthorchis felineus TaxID=147828 RepID=A0A4S2LWK2_OPIFE|nr:hypothetical protein CRM22_004347 [Opisthorchis felineus]
MRVQRYLLRGWIVNLIHLLLLGALLFQQISVCAIPVLRASPSSGTVQTGSDDDYVLSVSAEKRGRYASG